MKMTLDDMLRLRAELPSLEGGPVELTEDELKQLQEPCECPSNGNAHQYDCPKMKLACGLLWERGSEQDKQNFVRAFSGILAKYNPGFGTGKALYYGRFNCFVAPAPAP